MDRRHPPCAAARLLAAGLTRAAADLVLGSCCAGCGSPGVAACAGCLAALGRPGVARPDPCPPGLPPVAAAGAYVGPVRALVLAHKEQARLSLAAPLGRALAGAAAYALGDSAAPGVALVPVPSRPGSARRRGHDPLLRTARVAAAALRRDGLDVRVVPVLRLRRRVADQAGLDAAQRQANQHAAMGLVQGAAGALDGRRLLLVDDVLTTGATLAEAARALRAGGREPVGAGVLAATPRRVPTAVSAQRRRLA